MRDDEVVYFRVYLFCRDTFLRCSAFEGLHDATGELTTARVPAIFKTRLASAAARLSFRSSSLPRTIRPSPE